MYEKHIIYSLYGFFFVVMQNWESFVIIWGPIQPVIQMLGLACFFFSF